jgi:hypothetical protein
MKVLERVNAIAIIGKHFEKEPMECSGDPLASIKITSRV